MTSTRIMVVEEKHGTYYYDISTDELWAYASLDLLTRRWNEGYWYGQGDDDYDEIKRIVAEQDVSLVTYGKSRPRTEPVAWEVLYRRSDWQYEGVRIEQALIAEGPSQ